jgi:hypothetical protein
VLDFDDQRGYILYTTADSSVGGATSVEIHFMKNHFSQPLTDLPSTGGASVELSVASVRAQNGGGDDDDDDEEEMEEEGGHPGRVVLRGEVASVQRLV